MLLLLNNRTEILVSWKHIERCLSKTSACIGLLTHTFLSYYCVLLRLRLTVNVRHENFAVYFETPHLIHKAVLFQRWTVERTGRCMRSGCCPLPHSSSPLPVLTVTLHVTCFIPSMNVHLLTRPRPFSTTSTPCHRLLVIIFHPSSLPCTSLFPLVHSLYHYPLLPFSGSEMCFCMTNCIPLRSQKTLAFYVRKSGKVCLD